MLKHKSVRPKTSEKKLFKSGDIAPVSGNYRYEKHNDEVPDCVPRYGAYVHLMKGMKIPLHDDCMKPATWWLMTVTEEDPEMMLKR
jgi:hypothetical protein